MAVDFFAGCLGGCAGVLVGHPFDTVKVRLQIQDAKKPVYRGTFHCFYSIIKKEAVPGLFKGMSSPMAGLALINAIVFGVYGNIQRYVDDPDSLSGQFLAGTVSGMVQCIVTSPMELAKIRMQIQGQDVSPKYARTHNVVKAYKNPLDCLIKVRRKEGIAGVYRGLGITFLRDAPGFGAYFVGYEVLSKRLFSDEFGNITTARTMVAGGMAGMFSWVVCYPTDVVKSRLQADGMTDPKKYKNMVDCAAALFKEEGFRGFFRGFNTTIIRAFPTNAATFSVVAWVIRMYEERNGIDRRRKKHAIILEKDVSRMPTSYVESWI